MTDVEGEPLEHTVPLNTKKYSRKKHKTPFKTKIKDFLGIILLFRLRR